ncbi:EAL domain-containing protein [Shewanella sp. AS16]|uniref:putative bifunctional diguanylate cyclase/phosphodiesterase n=1 Tax=Shewanella sp. AS16 TaxID=2907625 RepID=UPI001F463AA8|nr:GGDEF domain-containing phosphodiesterase [Shewanella sp. AS16]MCE9687130.1 EAL domain-containing protein [Shewanella sp. AS16]
MDKCIVELSQRLKHSAGVEYLSDLVQWLNSRLDACYIAISVVDEVLLQAKVLAGVRQGQPIAELEYSLVGTPCAVAFEHEGVCIFPEQVQELFPDDPELVTLEASSYLGCAIYSEQGLRQGLLTLVFTREASLLEFPEWRPLIDFCVLLIRNELSRIRSEQQQLQERELLLEAQRLGKMGNYRWDLITNEAYWSPPLCQIFGVAETCQFSHQEYKALVHPQDWEKVERVIAACLANPGQAHAVQYRIHTPQGELKYLSSKGVVTVDGKQPIRMDGVTRDITDIQLQNEQLGLAKLVFDNTSESILICDRHNRILAVNPAFSELTGYSEAEVLGKNPAILSSGRQSASFYQQMWQCIRRQGHWSGEIWNRCKDGAIYPEFLRINIIYDADHNIDKYVAIFTNISSQKEAEAQIRFQASYDALTGIPNRFLFRDRLGQAIEQCQRLEQHSALFFIDLDLFKGVNDSLGHLQGDSLLKEVAARLSGSVRQGDTVARLGGDEFAVIAHGMRDHDSAGLIAHKIQQVLSKPFALGELRLHMTASIGIALYPNDSDTTEGLMSHADQALYLAKHSGRNTFRFFTHSMQQSANRRLRLKTALHKAIDEQKIEVHYQPIVDCQSGRMVKCEALARWHDEEFGQVSPAEFIAVAEEFGLMPELGNLILHRALNDWKTLQQLGFGGIGLSINRSTLEFVNVEFGALKVPELVLLYGLDPKLITIEITESLLMEEHQGMRPALYELSELGIEVAIDDFGTGYSSLSYLRNFPVKILKIDRSFVDTMVGELADYALVRGIIEMAKALGIDVVAEGVETEQQWSQLQQLGCQYCQGYLFAKAMSVEDLQLRLEAA